MIELTILAFLSWITHLIVEKHRYDNWFWNGLLIAFMIKILHVAANLL